MSGILAARIERVIHILSTDESRGAVLVEAERGQDASAIAAEFRSPPITEVSLAVSFQPLSLGVVELGDLWREYETEFPKVQQQAPIQLPQERFEGPIGQVPAFSFEMVDTPTVPRLWFLNELGTELLQVQADWFALNWRETEDAREGYPLYLPMRDEFEKDFRKLAEFTKRRNLGDVVPVQAEITYINHVQEADLSRVLRAVQEVPGLPTPESTSYAVQYILAKDQQPIGRLYLQGTKAFHRSTGKPISVVTITARGRPLGDGLEGALSFLDFGAAKALEAFIYATRSEMHESWRQG